MAKCDEGYLCSVCGNDVADIAESDLYLRFVTGMLHPEVLHTTPERHIRCNPVVAQFIVHDQFEPLTIEGDFDKRKLDPQVKRDREHLLTRGWVRLQELKSLLKTTEMAITEYPLPEFANSVAAKED